jgi:hypothetical protein
VRRKVEERRPAPLMTLAGGRIPAQDGMNWIEVTWVGMSAASVTLGAVHLLVWFKQRTQVAHLLRHHCGKQHKDRRAAP